MNQRNRRKDTAPSDRAASCAYRSESAFCYAASVPSTEYARLSKTYAISHRSRGTYKDLPAGPAPEADDSIRAARLLFRR